MWRSCVIFMPRGGVFCARTTANSTCLARDGVSLWWQTAQCRSSTRASANARPRWSSWHSAQRVGWAAGARGVPADAEGNGETARLKVEWAATRHRSVAAGSWHLSHLRSAATLLAWQSSQRASSGACGLASGPGDASRRSPAKLRPRTPAAIAVAARRLARRTPRPGIPGKTYFLVRSGVPSFRKRAISISIQEERRDVDDRQPEEERRGRDVEERPGAHRLLDGVMRVELQLLDVDRLQVLQLPALVLRQERHDARERLETRVAPAPHVREVAPRRVDPGERRHHLGLVEAEEDLGAALDQLLGLLRQARDELRDPLEERLDGEVPRERARVVLLHEDADEARDRHPDREEEEQPADRAARLAEAFVREDEERGEEPEPDVALDPALRAAERLREELPARGVGRLEREERRRRDPEPEPRPASRPGRPDETRRDVDR